MSNFDINVDRRTDARTDGKADAYIASCYKQVRHKEVPYRLLALIVIVCYLLGIMLNI